MIKNLITETASYYIAQTGYYQYYYLCRPYRKGTKVYYGFKEGNTGKIVRSSTISSDIIIARVTPSVYYSKYLKTFREFNRTRVFFRKSAYYIININLYGDGEGVPILTKCLGNRVLYAVCLNDKRKPHYCTIPYDEIISYIPISFQIPIDLI